MCTNDSLQQISLFSDSKNQSFQVSSYAAPRRYECWVLNTSTYILQVSTIVMLCSTCARFACCKGLNATCSTSELQNVQCLSARTGSEADKQSTHINKLLRYSQIYCWVQHSLISPQSKVILIQSCPFHPRLCRGKNRSSHFHPFMLFNTEGNRTSITVVVT